MERLFHFDAMWMKSRDYAEVNKQTYDCVFWVNACENLLDKIQNYGLGLIKWSTIEFGNINKEADSFRSEIQSLMQDTLKDQVKGEIGRLELELDQLLDKEEIMWSQCSKEHWLSKEDCNTKYFHSKACQT